MPEQVSSPAGQTPRAAIIIPHYNDLDRLTRCLAALVDGAGPRLQGLEVLICDNGSTEPVAETLADLLAAHPQIRLLHEPKKGAAHARNCGVAASTAPRLWFLDADCVPAPDWVAQADAASSDPQADLLAGRVDVFDETPAPRSGAEAFETIFAFDCESYVKQGFTVTANLLTTRAVFDRTGPFIDGVPEDKEWCLRARAHGATIAYVPALAVSHPTRQDGPALIRKWRRLVREAWGQEGRSLSARLRWLVRAMLVAASALAHQPRVWRSPRLTGFTERRRAALTLIAIRLQRAGWMIRQVLGGSV